MLATITQVVSVKRYNRALANNSGSVIANLLQKVKNCSVSGSNELRYYSTREHLVFYSSQDDYDSKGWNTRTISKKVVSLITIVSNIFQVLFCLYLPKSDCIIIHVVASYSFITCICISHNLFMYTIHQSCSRNIAVHVQILAKCYCTQNNP